MTNMLDILKNIGLENHSVEAVGSEFEQDMAALESFIDLEASLNVSALESAMESIGYTQLAIAEAAGVEGDIFARLGEIGFVGTEAVVDVASRQWYKLKTVIKALVNTVINFFKKILSLGNVTDKAMKAVKKKAEAYDKRWGKEAGYVKLENDKEYKTAAKNLIKPLNFVSAWLSSDSGAVDLGTNKAIPLQDILNIFKSITATTVEGFIKWTTDTSNVGLQARIEKVAGDYDTADKKDAMDKAKEVCDELLKDGSETEDLSGSTYKTAVRALLTEIKTQATAIESSKLSRDLDKALKTFEKIRTDLGKMKDVAKDTLLGGGVAGAGQAEWEKASENVSKVITYLVDLPKAYSMMLKTVISAANKGFTEVERCLSMR